MRRENAAEADALGGRGGIAGWVRVAFALASLALSSPCAWSYAVTGSRWTTSPVVMHLQLGATGAPLLDGSASWGASAEAALALWNSNIQAVKFAPVPDSTAALTGGNRLNNVFFAADIYGEAWGSGVLAVALTYSSAGRTVESDVIFNRQLNWNSYRGPQRYTSTGAALFDFQRVALHEFGHVLGLDHPDVLGQSVVALMNSRITGLDTLAADDIAGGRALYGTPAGAVALPVITTQPVSQTAVAGQTVSFGVVATSSASLLYQWQKAGFDLPGATLPTLTLTQVTSAHAGTYAVRVTNSAGSVMSSPATLAVSMPVAPAPVAPPPIIAIPVIPPPPPVATPSITSAPASQTVIAGNRVAFAVSAGGTAPLSYQWRKSGTAIAGATLSVYTIAAAQAADAGSYDVRVTNPGGSVTSAPAALTVLVPPAITVPPAGRTIRAGTAIELAVEAAGTPALRYQWIKDGAPVPGATASRLAFAAAQPSDDGTYAVTVTNAAGSTSSAGARVAVQFSRLVNLSTRGYVPPGGTLTPGFVVRGTAAKQVILRAVGPTLRGFGIEDALATPALHLLPSGTQQPLLSNDGWAGTAELGGAFATVGAFPLPPGSADAAGRATVLDGGYTIRISSSQPAGSGVALAELYDADLLAAPSRMVNASTLGFVGTGEQALTPGFVIRGNATKRLLIRAVGPGLTPFGVTDVLNDPQLIVIPLGANTSVGRNDNWEGAEPLQEAFRQAGAFRLEPSGKDAAVVVELAPGGYTVVISGADGAVGTALVEIYDLDP